MTIFGIEIKDEDFTLKRLLFFFSVIFILAGACTIGVYANRLHPEDLGVGIFFIGTGLIIGMGAATTKE